MTIAQIGTILVRLVNDHEIFPPECGFKKYFDYIHDNNQAVKYVRHLSNLFQLCKVPVTGKRILDAGCGYGLTSLVTRLLGAKEVYGVDLKTDRIMKFGSYLRQLWFNIDGITPVFGDVGRLCFKSESFDAILVNEAISHYGDTEKFLVEARRLLKIGGIIYISDANNACNPLIQWKNRIIWEKFEKGPQGISVYGHQIEKPMEYQRYEIIKRNFPYLSDQQLENLARTTSGLWGKGLLSAVEKYIKTGHYPDRKYVRGMCPRNPTRGSFVEMVLHPKVLKRKMEIMGFKTRIYSHFCGARNETLHALNQVLAAMTPITIYGARGFRLVASKI